MSRNGLFERAPVAGAITRTGGIAVAVLLSLVIGCAPPPPTGDVRDPWPSETRAAAPAPWLRPDIADVAYGPMAGCGAGSPTHEPCLGSQTVDVYLPRGSVSRGTLLLIHGGGFVSGDKRDLTGLGPLLHQTDRGWGVVVVNYRLARVGQGVHPFPTALQDVADAVRWVRDHGRSVGLDPARVVAAGHSAGGTLAALLGVAWNAPRAEYAGVPRVDGWVSVAGILEPSSGAMSRSWFGLWAGPWAPSWYAAAPATWIDPTDPPGWIIHGDRDRFVEPENARRMIDAARRTGSGSVSLDVVDRWHGGAAQPEAHRSHSPMGGANLAALESWLDAR